MGKILNFLREFILGLSIVTIIVGIIVLLMGVIFYWLPDLQLGFYTDVINDLGEWNAFLLVGGLIIFGIGVYYLYSYFDKKKFVMEELETNKRSEFLKKHSQLKSTVKHLPKKYQIMVRDKEEELNVK